MDLLFIPKLQRVVLCLNRFVPRSGALIPFQAVLVGKLIPIPQNWTGYIFFRNLRFCSQPPRSMIARC
jgi:hypothetical protein